VGISSVSADAADPVITMANAISQPNRFVRIRSIKPLIVIFISAKQVSSDTRREL